MNNRRSSLLVGVGYKIVAQFGRHQLNMLDTCESSIARNVTANLYERHLKRVFQGEQSLGATTSAARTRALADRCKTRSQIPDSRWR